MTTPMPVLGAPYIDPVTLLTAPTGIDWDSIPPGDDVTPAQNEAEWWNMCQRATAKVDGFCNQVLRATLDTELLHGPDYRVTVGPGAGGSTPTPYWGNAGYNARVILARWPILGISQVLVSPSGTWPRQWATVPTGNYEPEIPPIGIYNSIAPSASAFGGQSILIAPGYIDKSYGRNGYAVQVQYTNGWPHASITASATAGSTTMVVDDCTGWASVSYFGQTGATGVIKDSGVQETCHVTSATATVGPGTLGLSSGLVYPHGPGTIFSTMPASIEQACILFATAEALTRGATTTTIQDISGHSQHTGGDVQGLNVEAEILLRPFKRMILCPAASMSPRARPCAPRPPGWRQGRRARRRRHRASRRQ